MIEKIRVFHVEDYKFMRDAVKSMLENDPAIMIVGMQATVKA